MRKIRVGSVILKDIRPDLKDRIRLTLAELAVHRSNLADVNREIELLEQLLTGEEALDFEGGSLWRLFDVTV